MNQQDKEHLMRLLIKDPDYKDLDITLCDSNYLTQGMLFSEISHERLFGAWPNEILEMLDECKLFTKQDSYNMHLVNIYLLSLVTITMIWDLIDNKLVCNGALAVVDGKYGLPDDADIQVGFASNYVATAEIPLLVRNSKNEDVTVVLSIYTQASLLDREYYLKRLKFHFNNLSNSRVEEIYFNINDVTVDNINQMLEKVAG